jgi:hypothetical protein
MKLLFTLLSILLLVSCTITKRHSGRGYHVEWKKVHAKTENETEPLNTIDAGQEHSMRSEESEVRMEAIIPTDSVNTPERISSDPLETLVEEQTIVLETQSEFKDESLLKSEPVIKDDSVEPKRKVELFTWISLGGLGLAIIFALLSLTVLAIEFTWIFIAVNYFIFVISSMISIVHIRENPGAYKAKALSWTLFGLSLATIAGTIGFTIYKVVEFFR